MYRNKKIFSMIIIFLIINIFLIKFQTLIVPNNEFSSYLYLLDKNASGIDIRSYIFMYPIFCMLLYMNINYEKYYTLIKYRSRKKSFLNFRLKNILITAVIYALMLYIALALVGVSILGLENMIFFGYFTTSLFAIFYDVI
ncbi:MAG: hypothetical protein ACK5HR_00780 [Mycoplasmatales bacterium]